MILRSSPPSPFGRKVKLAVGILGLENDVTIEKADPTDASDSLRRQNPIGKIPEYKYCAVKIERAHGKEERVPKPSLNVTAAGL